MNFYLTVAVLVIMLATLKITGLMTLSWLVVFSPVITVACVALVFLVASIFAIMIALAYNLIKNKE